MGGTAKISWPDSGNWSKKNDGVTFPVKRGGLSWTGQSDGIDLYGEETGNDNLDLVLKFTDDNSNSLRIVNASGTTTAKITATGTFTGKASTAGIADTATTATSATTSNGVKDYNDANKTIQIGYAGSVLTASNLNYVAGYTDNGTKIKDVSKEVLTSWIGLGNYLPLSGGIVTGQIKKDTGGSWIGDRDRVLARSHFPGKGSYGAVAGIATTNGFWTMGSLGGDERLIFNYSTDSNYSAGNNSTSQVYLPAQAGTIITSATIGSQSVNYANSAGSVAWGNVSGKPSTFTPASHTHPYLPVAGGTMTGALTFANNTWNLLLALAIQRPRQNSHLLLVLQHSLFISRTVNLLLEHILLEMHQAKRFVHWALLEIPAGQIKQRMISISLRCLLWLIGMAHTAEHLQTCNTVTVVDLARS